MSFFRHKTTKNVFFYTQIVFYKTDWTYSKISVGELLLGQTVLAHKRMDVFSVPASAVVHRQRYYFWFIWYFNETYCTVWLLQRSYREPLLTLRRNGRSKTLCLACNHCHGNDKYKNDGKLKFQTRNFPKELFFMPEFDRDPQLPWLMNKYESAAKKPEE